MMNAQEDEALERSLQSARDLAAYYQRGNPPAPQPSPIALGQGEQYYGQFPAQILQWQPGDGSYTQTSVLWFGGVFSTALAIGGSAIVNATARRRAEERAAVQWRPVDTAVVHITNQRIALEGAVWADVWYGSIRKSDCNPTSIMLDIAGWPSTRLDLWAAYYWFVMFRKLAYDDIVLLPERTAEGHEPLAIES